MSSRLFVYGTLRRGSPVPIASELHEGARWLGEARLRGRLFDLGEHPALVPGHGIVFGDLFEQLPAALLQRLDRYEGGDYVRRESEVEFGDTVVRAWVYWYRAPLGAARPLPGGRYPLGSDPPGG